MLKHRFLVAVSALSITAFALTPLTYAHEAQPSDDRGGVHHEIQVDDDHGVDQLDDDRAVDAAQNADVADDNGVDALPHD